MKKQFIACTLAVSATLFASPSAFAKGAIAVNKHDPNHWGFSVNQDSEREANRVADEHCNGDCEIVFNFEHTCAAYAKDRDSSHYGYAHDDDEDRAKRKAKDECGRDSCEVIHSGCDN
jgi:hypothetical protein